MNYGPQNQGPGNCGTTKGVEKIVEESDLVLQSQHFLTIVIASLYIYFEIIVSGCRSWNSLTSCPFQLWQP